MSNQNLPSNRSFGLLFTTLFLVLGFWHIWKDGNWIFIWVASLVGIITILIPSLLEPFNRGWMQFGKLMHKVINPLVMAVLFFVVITPAGIIMRLFGHDPMCRKFDRESSSYWVHRQEPGIQRDSLKNQF